MVADVVENECCHGKGCPPELIGTEGAPAVPAVQPAAREVA